MGILGFELKPLIASSIGATLGNEVAEKLHLPPFIGRFIGGTAGAVLAGEQLNLGTALRYGGTGVVTGGIGDFALEKILGNDDTLAAILSKINGGSPNPMAGPPSNLGISNMPMAQA